MGFNHFICQEGIESIINALYFSLFLTTNSGQLNMEVIKTSLKCSRVDFAKSVYI